MTITWDDLTVNPEGVDFDDLLSSWRWLVGTEYRPTLISAIGDLFLNDESGGVFWLDAGSGELTKVAESDEEFSRLILEPDNVERWFIPGLIEDLIASGMKLSNAQCYSYKRPPILGGEFDISNFEPCSLSVHFNVLGQIHEQVKDLPPGTPISKIKIKDP